MDDYRAEKGGGGGEWLLRVVMEMSILAADHRIDRRCEKREGGGDESEDSQPYQNLDKNKRRKVSPPCAPHLTDLPDALLADVATYLSKPSRALFAVAMTAPSSSWAQFNGEMTPSAMCRAIISSSAKKNPKEAAEQSGTLDFVDVEKSLAARLTDDDLAAILVCINAKNTLKILKLTGCINVNGGGLEPLRGSVVLEQIDLSLAGRHDSPNIKPDPSISEAAVQPILNSIICANGNSLKHVLLPKSWRTNGRNGSSLLAEFLDGYNLLLQSRRLRCSKCDDSLNSNSLTWLYRNNGDINYGLQNFTCYNCFDHMCYDCGEGENTMGFCSYCDKDFCPSCARMDMCYECSVNYCKKCSKIYECEACDHSFCGGCCESYECRACGRTCKCCGCAEEDEIYCSACRSNHL